MVGGREIAQVSYKGISDMLSDLRPQKGFFIGVDSDGCAFDTMEFKHRECFIPNTITHFGLQGVCRYAREAAEFVNLYSKWRGVNRFPALLLTMDLVGRRPEVRERQALVPELAAIRRWVEGEPRLGNPGLEAAVCGESGEAAAELRRVLEWSKAVNEAVASTARGLPPFAFVDESLGVAGKRADIVVISATPGEALEREWGEYDLAEHVVAIAGQEMGTKAEQLRVATEGKYAKDRVLMIGDAPGDLAAARANGVRFYPINAGAEAVSWKRLLEVGLDLFFAERFGGSYAEELVAVFEGLLPETPPWPLLAEER